MLDSDHCMLSMIHMQCFFNILTLNMHVIQIQVRMKPLHLIIDIQNKIFDYLSRHSVIAIIFRENIRIIILSEKNTLQAEITN